VVGVMSPGSAGADAGAAAAVRTVPAFRSVAAVFAAVLVLAAGAWAGTVALARPMAGMTGAMGLTLPGFVAVWTLMMAAMMLPSVTPLASLYARTMRTHRGPRLAALVAGYLAVWAAAGLPAYGLARLAGWLAGGHPAAAHVAAVLAFASCGVYQLTGLKNRCLAHCRSPLSLLLHYGSRRGRFRDLLVGVHHGGYCLGCCVGLMVILVAAGVMNISVMLALATLVLAEKVTPWGPLVARLAGVAALALALATIWLPWLAPGLHTQMPMPMMS
jgi:predicted metal-binding membrane protein